MRLHVVYDDQGTILAAAQVGEGDAKFDVPLAEPGEHAAEIDVPAEFAERGRRGLHELVPHLQVNVKEKRLVERR
jgi:hypothetical protein